MRTSSSSRGARGWIVAPALDGRAGMVGMGGTGVQLADARTKHAPDQMVHVVHHRQMSHLSVTHPAEGLMRRLVDASRMRIPVPFRSRPRWSRRIPTGIAPGIGHGHAWVLMKSHWQQGGYPKLAASAPNATNHSTDSPGTRPDVPSTSRLPCRRTGRRARSASQGDRAGSGDWLTAKTERAGASTRTNCTSRATAPRSGRIARLRR